MMDGLKSQTKRMFQFKILVREDFGANCKLSETSANLYIYTVEQRAEKTSQTKYIFLHKRLCLRK